MRIKEVEVEQQKFKIASLTVDQVDSFFPGTKTEADGRNAIKRHSCPVVAASLNNALDGNGKWFPNWPNAVNGHWDGARVAAELDFAEVVGLYKEITDFSGLKTEEKRGELPPGEAKAATTIN